MKRKGTVSNEQGPSKKTKSETKSKGTTKTKSKPTRVSAREKPDPKYADAEPAVTESVAGGAFTYAGSVLETDEQVKKRDGYQMPIPKKNTEGVLVFPDSKEFRPNMTPKEVLQAGSFGGTYFRPIKSSVTGLKYNKMWNELPQNWLEGLDVKTKISSTNYDTNVNTYKVKCGGSLEMWETSGWIQAQDPYGWFMWYCRFYLGRRTEDDERQISRWKNCAGLKGRWKGNLISKIARSGARYDDFSISPVVRQTLQHWGYVLTPKDYEQGKKRVKM